MDDPIHSLAHRIAERCGERALACVLRQFDAAEGATRLVWGRIMEWLILHAEERA